MVKKRKKNRNGVIRAVLVGIALLLQVGWILLMVLKLNRYSTAISLLTGGIAAVAVLKLYSKNTNSAFKMPWTMLMMALPVMGLSLYLLVKLLGSAGGLNRRAKLLEGKFEGDVEQDPDILEQLAQRDRSVANQCGYLWQHGENPVYAGTRTEYYAEAVDAYIAMKAALEQAEDFIFMEYFIIEDAEAFDGIREILTRKVSQGVEVRLMYDDVGSIGYVDLSFAWQLNAEGIHCRAFNPALPFLNISMNNRDHRKIAVIDGKVAFTGGYNLANEYFTDTPHRGHWKDTGLRLEGDAVRSMTAAFLKQWSLAGGKEEKQWEKYLLCTACSGASGYVQPYLDSPLTAERTAENVYLNLISHAREYIYFMTPYLIITDELRRALGLAAKRGVDVRIITPGIPDKKTVYRMTRSYYSGLAEQGVRIYEFTPGFCHAKQCVCDGTMAMIGTSNLDYRSLYLHFENDVLLYHCQAVEDMAQDFREMFPQCRDVTQQYSTGRSAILRLWQCILRLFAPML